MQNEHVTSNTYINMLILKYNHPQPEKSQHSPHAHREIIYGANEQLMPNADMSPPLYRKGTKQVQGIVRLLLYYARAIANKLLATLSTIVAQQAASMENTAKAVNQLLDYVAIKSPDWT